MLKTFKVYKIAKTLFSRATMRTFRTIYYLPLFAAVSLVFSCKSPQPDAALKRRADSLDAQLKIAKLAQQQAQRTADSALRAQHVKDSLAKIAAVEHKEAPKATPHYGPCPVIVKASYLTGSAVNKAIIVSLKNTSKKKIDAVKLTWTVYNHAGKAIGSSGGMAKKNLAKGRAGSYSWSVNAPNGTKAKAAVAYVHFADGTVWATK